MERTRSVQEDRNGPGTAVTAVRGAAQPQSCSPECMSSLTKGMCERART